MYMLRYRAEFREMYPVDQTKFTVGPRGAPGNPLRGRDMFDNTRSEAYSPVAIHFCDAYGFNKSFSAAYNAHTRQRSVALALAHHDKMLWFLRIWEEHGLGPYEFSDEDAGGWLEPDSFTELAADPGLSRATTRSIAFIRNLRPGLWRPVMD